MMQRSLKHLFADKKVLVIGDAMIDAYYLGSVSRISPEAPVPIIEIESKSKRLGGAANVALNVVALGASASLCALCGDDDNAKELKRLCSESGIDSTYLIESKVRSTTVKTRIISRGQHLLRVDEETKHYTTGDEELEIIQQLENAIKQVMPDVVIIEDYNKGLLSEKVIQHILKCCNEKSILSTVDPKFYNFNAYHGAGMFKPNLKEVKEGLKMEVDPTSIESLDSAADALMDSMNIERIFITLSEYGVYFKEKGIKGCKLPAHKRKIMDVSGAGDTVISIASLALASGLSNAEAFALANIGGGLVCEEEGVVPIDLSRLEEEARKFIFEKI